MANEKRPFVIGLFDETNQAQQAINRLQQNGWQQQQILFVPAGSQQNTLPADLVNMGVPQGEVQLYQQELSLGHSIVAVLTGDRYQEVLDILVSSGASNPDQQTASRNVREAQGNVQVPLREEQLNVNKRTVQAGEVTLRKEIVNEQQTIDVPVSHEEVYIERRSLAEQPSTTPIGEDETIRIPVNKEQVQVSKQAVETGEVAIGKRNVQKQQRVSDSVKREEVQVERAYNENVPGEENNP